MASLVWGILNGSLLVGHHLVVTQSRRMPASTILLISASPMTDDTHSLSLLSPAATFFGFPAPFFGAISWICLGIGSGNVCESRSVRAEEEDEMAKWQRWQRGVRRRSYKALPHLFAFEGFWETAPRFVPLRIL